jgi:FMN-dependent NADH-azoreductase
MQRRSTPDNQPTPRARRSPTPIWLPYASGSRISVDTLDLLKEKIPDFEGDKVAAKMAVITGPTRVGRRRLWEEIIVVANRLIAADRYLLAVPMWTAG